VSLTKLSLGGNNDVIYELFPARESLVSDIPAGDGKIVNLFLQCNPLRAGRGGHLPCGSGRLLQVLPCNHTPLPPQKPSVTSGTRFQGLTDTKQPPVTSNLKRYIHL
jgi:hypothetical protein